MLIAQELGAMRRTQEDAVADKKTAPKKRWGVEQISTLLHLARIPSKPNFPPMYTALAVGNGGQPKTASSYRMHLWFALWKQGQQLLLLQL